MVEDLFPEAQGLRGDFKIFVLGEIFETAFEAVFEGRAELDAFAVSLRTHIGQILGFAGIHHHIGGTGVFANDHACIDVFLWSDEKGSPFLEVFQRVGGGGARLEGDENAVNPGWDFAAVRPVFAEQMGDDTHTFC